MLQYCSRLLARPAKLDGNARPTMMIDECRARSLRGNKTLRRRKCLDDRNGIYIYNVMFDRGVESADLLMYKIKILVINLQII